MLTLFCACCQSESMSCYFETNPFFFVHIVSVRLGWPISQLWLGDVKNLYKDKEKKRKNTKTNNPYEMRMPAAHAIAVHITF